MFKTPMPFSVLPSLSAKASSAELSHLAGAAPSSLDYVRTAVRVSSQARPDIEMSDGERLRRRTEAAASVPVPADPNDVAPIFYDGAEDFCSICAEHFRADDQVCRLTCRHMFHHQCWEHYRADREANMVFPSCPNCRGAGTLIAVWKYLSSTVTTQQVGSLMAENQLESGVQCHQLNSSAESSVAPTPRHEPNTTSEGSLMAELGPHNATFSSSFFSGSPHRQSVWG